LKASFLSDFRGISIGFYFLFLVGISLWLFLFSMFVSEMLREVWSNEAFCSEKLLPG
jgi:uncharacterized membrane protein